MSEKLGASVKEAAVAMGISAPKLYQALRDQKAGNPSLDFEIPVIEFGKREIIPWAWIRRLMSGGAA